MMNEYDPLNNLNGEHPQPDEHNEPSMADVQININSDASREEDKDVSEPALHIDLSEPEQQSSQNAGLNSFGEQPASIPGQIKMPYNESVPPKKKKKAKRAIAAGLAVAVLNLAILGGAFMLGRSFGKEDLKVGNKQQLVENLNQNAQSTEGTQVTSTANNNGDMDTTEIAKKVGPAVVGITSTVQGQMSIFGGAQNAQAQGSGIVLSSDGYIATNNHVIDGATAVKVTLNTGTEYDANVVGSDAETDLAVIKIEPTEELTVATLGDSSALEVGERVVAIGNPMGLEFFGSVTQGIVSAKNRTITVDNRTMTLIQTDAAINSGNSGGALINTKGEVIGINSVKVTYEGVEGMGFAIPISEAKPIISDLLEHGYVKGRPVIGISTRDVTEYMAARYSWPQGVQVMDVTSQSAADAGLQQGDIIISVNGQKISTGDELNKIKEQHAPGEVLKLEVYKYDTGLTKTIEITLSEQLPG